MKIAVIGLNHKTAPVHIREQLALSAEQIPDALKQLTAQFPDVEFLLLSTCNRVELYCASTDTTLDPHTYAQQLCQFCNADFTAFNDHCYLHRNNTAVKHLLTVASSLDSLVVGEAQIIAQVKDSYRIACRANSAGKILHRLLHCAFSTGKEIVTTTSIAQRRVSVAGVAVELANTLFKPLADAHITVIGAGQMGELLIRHFLDLECKNIVILNRTFSRANKLAKQFNLKAHPWSKLQSQLAQTDIVVAAAQAEEIIFDTSVIPPDRNRTLLIIDIAVPRNFDPAVKELPHVQLYSIDDLAQISKQNLKGRREDLKQARQIIADNVESFMDWFGVIDIGPLIGRLRDRFHALARLELQRTWSGNPDFSPLQKQHVEAAINRVVNKMLHQLIQSLHSLARTRGPEVAAKLIESHITAIPNSTDRPCPSK